MDTEEMDLIRVQTERIVAALNGLTEALNKHAEELKAARLAKTGTAGA